MTTLLLFCALSFAPATEAPVPLPEASTVFVQDRKAEYEEKKAAAGKDPEKLWDLYLWCDAYGMEKEGRKCLFALLRVDENHKEAHELLGHIFYDGQWFTSERKLAKYKKDEEKRKADEEGLVKWKDEWVPIDDLPYLKKGFVKDDNGNWIDAEEQRRLDEGWRKQDLEWIAPADFDKLEQGLWKCGDKWLTLEEADKYHSSTNYPWVIPTDHFVLYTTCTRKLSDEIVKTAERAYRDLARIYGGAPPEPAPLVILNSADQYGSFAAGNDMTGRPATEVRGLSSTHYSYFADAWMKDDTFMGAGVGYWDDKAENGNKWGPHSVRHAAGLSIGEALDPSPKARAAIDSKGLSDRYLNDFYKEKRVPEWYRVGAATYVERYFVDNLVGSGGDANWAKNWSVQNLISKGGLRPLGDIFETQFRVDDADGTAKLTNECGLVMAFIMDGKCAPVIEAHGRVKQALTQDKDTKKAFDALRKAVIAHETELRKFGGI
jgi:hypothetical protein